MSTTYDRLGFAVIGLGLVHLLQDAKRFEEAHEVLYSLEAGCKGGHEKSAIASWTPRPVKPAKKRMQGVFAA